MMGKFYSRKGEGTVKFSNLAPNSLDMYQQIGMRTMGE